MKYIDDDYDSVFGDSDTDPGFNPSGRQPMPSS